jgi:serine/threonine protein kinase
MDGLIGQTIGGYQILEQIGEGGMATVYKAYQPSLDRYVAVKILPRHLSLEPGFSKRFTREARAVAKLEHPHILPIYDSGQEEGLSYIVMRFIDKGTLKDLMAQPLDLQQISNLIDQVAAALDQAHEQGYVHRDVKPSNVLLDRETWVLLSDFGLAKMMEGSEHITATGVGVGTPAYMSPEQGRGDKVDHRSDVYSLGVVLYEMLTGQVPYHAETPMAVVFKHIYEPLPLPRDINPEIPETLERILLKALAKDPADRYQSAGEMAEALRESIQGLESKALQAVTADQVPTVIERERDGRGKRSRQLLWLIPVFVIVLSVILVPRFLPQDEPIVGGLTKAPTITHTVESIAEETPEQVVELETTPTILPTMISVTQLPTVEVCLLTEEETIEGNIYLSIFWDGIQAAEEHLDVEGRYFVIQQDTGFERTVNDLNDEDCDLILVASFQNNEQIASAAEANPDRFFTTLGYVHDLDYDNVLGQWFASDQAAFLAGYLAASVTRTGVVGTYGGENNFSVRYFMDGFALGVQYYNQQHGTYVEVFGWDPATREGLFTGNFKNQEDGRRMGEQLLDAGADIIMPAAGLQGFGTADIVLEQGGAYIIGVDFDWALAAPEYAEITLTSVVQHLDGAVFRAIQQVVEGDFTGGIFTGTLENDGVRLAPFHNLDWMVSDALRSELDQLREAIIAGEIKTKPDE